MYISVYLNWLESTKLFEKQVIQFHQLVNNMRYFCIYIISINTTLKMNKIHNPDTTKKEHKDNLCLEKAG